MRKIALLVSLLLSVTSTIALALPPELESSRTLPPKGYGDVPQPQINLGGETFATATPIGALPYADGGNTCGFVNDYTLSCALSNAPDLVYRFTPATNTCVNVSLCGSGYDTMLLIHNGTTATDVACNDDSPACGLQSNLTNVALLAGNVYYIVVDGFNTACGAYQLNVSACPPPPVCPPCPPSAINEGEATCFDGYVDTYNAGCNSTPPTTLNLLCNPDVSICGTYGTFNANGSRDTDWYQFTLNAPTALTVSVSGHGLTGSALAVLDTACPPAVICGQFTASGTECSTTTCNVPVIGPGTFRIFTASFFDNTACGSTYVLRIQGMTCPPTDVTTASWGKLKTLYR